MAVLAELQKWGPSGTAETCSHTMQALVPAAVCLRADTWWGKHVFSLWIIKQRTPDSPSPIHFLAFLRELIIRIGGTSEKGRKTAPLKLGSTFSCQQRNTVPHQPPPELSGLAVIVFQLLSVTSKSNTALSLLFCCASTDQAKCESAVKMPRLLTAPGHADGGSSLGQAVGFWLLSLFVEFSIYLGCWPLVKYMVCNGFFFFFSVRRFLFLLQRSFLLN